MMRENACGLIGKLPFNAEAGQGIIVIGGEKYRAAANSEVIQFMKHTHIHRTRFCALALFAGFLISGGVWANDEFIEGTPSPHRPSTQPATEPTTLPATAPVPGKLSLSIWAATGWLKNPVALTFDRAGRCYVAQTQRREGGELQVRTDPARRVIPDHSFFHVEDRFRWAGDGDVAWGTQVGGKKEIITLLQDTKGSGKADKASPYYEGFNQNGNDILAGILWNDGNIYATLAPNLWLLRDRKNIGQADEVRSLSFGYGVHMSYSGHNMHGLTLGPDGKIYFTIGDKGLNVRTAEGRELEYPYCGSCLRCNPDGSDLEVFAYGLRNPQEIAFDKDGNLFAVDNDGDFPTERERLVYITEGSDSGWRFNYQYRSKNFDVAAATPAERKERYNPWMKEKLWVPYFPGQAAYITPALANYTDGPCGFKYATEGSLNDKYAGSFFVTEFPKATIRSFRVKPKGAYFTMYDDQIVSRGVQCTGLAFGPDGALYGAGWGKSGFKLGNTGNVVKLDDPFAAETPLRKQTHLLLSQGAGGRSQEELIKLLGHADMRVRLDAQFELVRRKALAVLLTIAADKSQSHSARIHALWGIAQFVHDKTLTPGNVKEVANVLRLQCADADDEIRAQAVKLAGELVRNAGRVIPEEAVSMLLNDASLRVRFFAAIALGRFKDPAAEPALLKIAAENHPIDAYVRHAIVMGLASINDVPALVRCAKNPSVEVRLTAVVALRRLQRPEVSAFLNDADESVATEAARAIHDDWSISEALPALAAAADRPNMTSEPFIRRALNANLRLGGGEQVDRLIRYAVNESRPSAMRVEAIDILANWEKPAVNDRVEGWYRTWPQRSGMAVRTALNAEVAGLLASDDHAVALAATQLIDRLGIKTDDAVFVGWVTDSSRTPDARVTALHLLSTRKYADLSKSVEEALASNEPLLRIEAMRILAEQEPARTVGLLSRVTETGTMIEKQAAFRLLGEMHNLEANNELSEWLGRLEAGDVPPEVQLDLIEGAESARNKELRKRLRAWEKKIPPNDPLAILYPTLRGGDAERGKAVFTSHPEAACVRCHTTNADGSGSSVGPNLAGIGAKADKPRRYLLESMIDPNAYIVPGYGMSSFKLRNGEEVAAFVRSETPTEIQLFDLEGKASVLKKSDIVSRTPAVSMMPAMGALLTRDEIRDVIEYLSSLKN